MRTGRVRVNDGNAKALREPVPNHPLTCEARRVAKVPLGVGPRFPQVVVLVGATGDLARRKLIPGLLHLARAGFIPSLRIVGMSLDPLDADGFRKLARDACDESVRKLGDTEW